MRAGHPDIRLFTLRTDNPVVHGRDYNLGVVACHRDGAGKCLVILSGHGCALGADRIIESAREWPVKSDVHDMAASAFANGLSVRPNTSAKS